MCADRLRMPQHACDVCQAACSIQEEKICYAACTEPGMSCGPAFRPQGLAYPSIYRSLHCSAAGVCQQSCSHIYWSCFDACFSPLNCWYGGDCVGRLVQVTDEFVITCS